MGLLKALHNHATVFQLVSFKHPVKLAIVVNKDDCSHSSPVFDPACSSDREGQSVLVGEPNARFDEPWVKFSGKCWKIYIA